MLVAIRKAALIAVPLAIQPLVTFERTAEVVLQIDDRPVAVDLDPLKLGIVDSAADRLGEVDISQVVTHLLRVELVVARDRDEGSIREQGGDELAERGVERRTPAGGIGEERPPPGVRWRRIASMFSFE